MTAPERRAQAVVDAWLEQVDAGPGPLRMNPEAVECLLAFREYRARHYAKPRRFDRLRTLIARLKVKP